jgi:hypothetical protein
LYTFWCAAQLNCRDRKIFPTIHQQHVKGQL